MAAKDAARGIEVASGFFFLLSIALGTLLLSADVTLADSPVPTTTSNLARAVYGDSAGVMQVNYDDQTCGYAECGDECYCDDQECGGCDDGGCDDGGCCGPSGRFWVQGDYLVWWTNGVQLPALVTTSPVGVLPPGARGAETTTYLFGNERVNDDGQSGFRFTAGYWLDCCGKCGIEGDYFELGGNPAEYSAWSSGDPVIARPFYDSVYQRETSQAIAYPGLVSGDIDARATEYLQGAGLRLRHNLCCQEPCCCDDCCDDSCCGDSCCQPECSTRVDLVGGYRYYRLEDRVAINEKLVATDPYGQVAAGTIFEVYDSFRTRNQFHGGEVGLIAEVERGRWSFEFLVMMALGNNYQTVTIDGGTGITSPGSETINYTGGLLALPSNIGRYSRNEFVVIPQFGLEVGYQLTCRLRAHVGYNFLYWVNVSRAAYAIDMDINPGQIPPSEETTPPPSFAFTDSDFWAQGLNVGVEWNY